MRFCAILENTPHHRVDAIAQIYEVENVLDCLLFVISLVLCTGDGRGVLMTDQGPRDA